MYILGISAFYHDSAAVLIADGKVVCAVEEERFTRIKHDNGFPFRSIAFCLQQEGIGIDDVTYIAYYEKPLLKFERILQTFVQTYPISLLPYLQAIPEWLANKIKVKHTIAKKLKYKGPVFFIPHHLSHAGAAFYPSAFGKAAILTVDGVGEYQTTGLWFGDKNKIIGLKKIDFPHSLGLLYSTFTSFLGFRVNEDEYKVMGLAAYGKPVFKNKMYKIIDIKEDGSFALDMKYFSFRQSFTMWSKEFEKLFGSPRGPSDPITKRHKDIAASIQEVIEEIYFKQLCYLCVLTNTKNLCIGGGVALNALANGKIFSNTPFKKVYVFGAAGDSGGAMGAGLFVWHTLLKKTKRNTVQQLALGSSFTNETIEAILKSNGLFYKKFESEKKLLVTVSQYLAQNKIIGWFYGKMEFGPRALGARSILANPKPFFMKEKVNRIKIRELFRPFAGSILEEKVGDYFEVPNQKSFPFMTFCFVVKEKRRKDIAAIVHKDNTCRIQTVSKSIGRYYRLIKEFYSVTGIPCLLNTSFNLKGEPIVENPNQAIGDFLKTNMDYLVIGDFLVSKPSRRG